MLVASLRLAVARCTAGHSTLDTCCAHDGTSRHWRNGILKPLVKKCVLSPQGTYDPFVAEASKALVDLQQSDDASGDEHDDEADDESKGEDFPSKSESCGKLAEGVASQPEASSGLAEKGVGMDIVAATTQTTGDAEGSESMGEERDKNSADGEKTQLEISACAAATATSPGEAEDATAEPMSQSQDEDLASEAENVGLARGDVEVQEPKRKKKAITGTEDQKAGGMRGDG